jgi:hypothetical protein
VLVSDDAGIAADSTIRAESLAEVRLFMAEGIEHRAGRQPISAAIVGIELGDLGSLGKEGPLTASQAGERQAPSQAQQQLTPTATGSARSRTWGTN